MNKRDAFIAQIARMKTEEEFEDGASPPSEDWISTLNELIVTARGLPPRKKRSPLIAAAPDLLKQLKSAAQMLNYLAPEKFDDDDHERNWNRMLEDMDRALAKAKKVTQ